MQTRCMKINQLEAELAKQAAQVARLEVRLIQSEIERDRSKVIDMPNVLTKRQELN